MVKWEKNLSGKRFWKFKWLCLSINQCLYLLLHSIGFLYFIGNFEIDYKQLKEFTLGRDQIDLIFFVVEMYGRMHL